MHAYDWLIQLLAILLQLAPSFLATIGWIRTCVKRLTVMSTDLWHMLLVVIAKLVGSCTAFNKLMYACCVHHKHNHNASLNLLLLPLLNSQLPCCDKLSSLCEFLTALSRKSAHEYHDTQVCEESLLASDQLFCMMLACILPHDTISFACHYKVVWYHPESIQPLQSCLRL